MDSSKLDEKLYENRRQIYAVFFLVSICYIVVELFDSRIVIIQPIRSVLFLLTILLASVALLLYIEYDNPEFEKYFILTTIILTILAIFAQFIAVGHETELLISATLAIVLLLKVRYESGGNILLKHIDEPNISKQYILIGMIGSYSLLLIGYLSVPADIFQIPTVVGPIIFILVIVFGVGYFIIEVSNREESAVSNREESAVPVKANGSQQLALIIATFIFLGTWKVGIPTQSPDTIQFIGRGFSYLEVDLGISSAAEWYRTKHEMPIISMTGTPGVTTGIVSVLSIYLFTELGIVSDPIAAARIGHVLTNAILLTISYRLIKIAWSTDVAVYTILIVALNPFFIALSRTPNPDSLLPGFVFLSVISFYLIQRRKFRYVYLFVIFFTLALLTKITAIILAPIFILWLIGISGNWDQPITTLHNSLNPTSIISLFSILIGFIFAGIFWPTLYEGTTGIFSLIQTLFLNVGAYQTSGQNAPQLVMLGHSFDHWPTGFYTIISIFRIPEVVLALLVSGLFYKGSSSNDKRLLILLTLCVSFMFLSYSSRKGEKYILFLLPFIAIIGAQVVELVKNQSKSIIFSMIIVAIILPGMVFTPYHYLSYNSASGYGENINDIYAAGWGDGHKEAADYVENNYEIESQVYILGYRSVFNYYYSGEANHLDPGLKIDDIDPGIYICYNAHAGRIYSSGNACQDLKENYETDKTLTINNVDMVYIYKIE